jgi:hypothetical protein
MPRMPSVPKNSLDMGRGPQVAKKIVAQGFAQADAGAKCRRRNTNELRG